MTSSVSSARPSIWALQQPLDDLVLVDDEAQHGVELVAGEVDHLVQLLDLGEGARVAVEQEALLGVLLVDQVADHPVGGLVGHVLAGIHVALRLHTQRGALRDVGAEDVAGGDGRDAEVLGDVLRLSTLAGPGRPHDDQLHQWVESVERTRAACWAHS